MFNPYILSGLKDFLGLNRLKPLSNSNGILPGVKLRSGLFKIGLRIFASGEGDR